MKAEEVADLKRAAEFLRAVRNKEADGLALRLESMAAFAEPFPVYFQDEDSYPIVRVPKESNEDDTFIKFAIAMFCFAIIVVGGWWYFK